MDKERAVEFLTTMAESLENMQKPGTPEHVRRERMKGLARSCRSIALEIIPKVEPEVQSEDDADEPPKPEAEKPKIEPEVQLKADTDEPPKAETLPEVIVDSETDKPKTEPKKTKK